MLSRKSISARKGKASQNSYWTQAYKIGIKKLEDRKVWAKQLEKAQEQKQLERN